MNTWKNSVLFLLLLLCIASHRVFPSQPLSGTTETDSLLLRRHSMEWQLKQFRDTMTVRTWLNMVKLSLDQQRIIELDDTLIHKMTGRLGKTDSLQQQLISLSEEISETRNILRQQRKINERMKQRRIIYLLVAGISALGVVTIALLLIFRSGRSKKHAELLRIKEIRIENLNSELENKNRELMESQQEVTDKTLQINKIESRLQEAQDTEKKLREKIRSSEELESAGKKTLMELQRANKELQQEKDILHSDLDFEKQRLEKEIWARKEIEKELRNLLDDLKGLG